MTGYTSCTLLEVKCSDLFKLFCIKFMSMYMFTCSLICLLAKREMTPADDDDLYMLSAHVTVWPMIVQYCCALFDCLYSF